MTQRLDRTGNVYGVVTVLGPDPLSPRRWAVRWGCCGIEQTVSSERCATMKQTPPTRCIQCFRKTQEDDLAYGAAKAQRERERCAALKRLENRPDESPTSGITIPGRGYWPFLRGPMGMRGGRGTGAVE